MSRSPPPVHSVLFVCLGNICRSPAAEGVLRAQSQALSLPLQIDSAGTANYHVGNPPDPRARRVARAAGTPIDDLRARQVEARDFKRFDLILAADLSVLQELQRVRPAQSPATLALLLEWAGLGAGLEVPDPYYGRLQEFEAVHQLLERACRGITARLRGVAECGGTHASERFGASS